MPLGEILTRQLRFTQPYRGFLLHVYIFPIAPFGPLAGWGYEVGVANEGGELLCGPYYSFSGYCDRDRAEEASTRRGRLAIDVLLG